MSEVIVYTKPGLCVQCVAAKRWLDANGVSYEERNALEHMEQLERVGIRQMPIIYDGNGGYFGGFDTERLRGIKSKQDGFGDV